MHEISRCNVYFVFKYKTRPSNWHSLYLEHEIGDEKIWQEHFFVDIDLIEGARKSRVDLVSVFGAWPNENVLNQSRGHWTSLKFLTRKCWSWKPVDLGHDRNSKGQKFIFVGHVILFVTICETHGQLKKKTNKQTTTCGLCVVTDTLSDVTNNNSLINLFCSLSKFCTYRCCKLCLKGLITNKCVINKGLYTVWGQLSVTSCFWTETRDRLLNSFYSISSIIWTFWMSWIEILHGSHVAWQEI